MAMSIEVSGVVEFVSDLDALADDIEQLDGDKLADRLVAIAQSFAPMRTGFLRKSIRQALGPDLATVGAFAPYAAVINYGSPSRGIRAQPFMDRTEAEADRLAPDMLDDAVEQAVAERGLA